MVRNLAFVEVAKREGGPWFEAILRDLHLEKAWVAFDYGVWPSREVACSQVRRRAEEKAVLQEAAKVEARLTSSESPAFWCSAYVVQVLQDAAMCYVAGKGEQILPLEALRAPSTEQALNPLAFTRLAVEVSAPLRPWLGLADCRGCLEQIRQQTQLHLATPGVQSPDGGNGVAVQELDCIILLGSAESTEMASMVVKIHLQHQGEVEAFHRRRKKKLALLKDLESKSVGEDEGASFEVSAELLGRTCGRKGERLHRVEQEFEVEIRLTEEEPRIFLIYGERAVDAREALELRQMKYQLSDESLQWFRKDNKILIDIAKKAELAFFSLEDAGLDLWGSIAALENARLMLESHLEYLPVYQEMDRQQEEISHLFEALDAGDAGARPSAKTKPKAKAKGGPKARGKQIGS